MTQRRAAQPRPSHVARWSDSRGRKEFHLLLATSRPAVHSFFVDLRRHASWPFVVVRIPVDVDALGRYEDHVTSATTAAVDVGLDQAGAIELCQELHRRRPDLPVAALACCPHSLTPWNFRALIAAGVSSVLDLQATSDEALRALQNVAGGGTVVHLQSLGGRRGLRDILSGGELRSRTQIELLELVARGLPDHEIGRRLHLSPHTVKHHIENVRNAVGVRNRIELAAWAGRNGFYAADDGRVAG